MEGKRIVVALLAVLVILMGVVFWLFLSQDRYEGEGDELAAKYQWKQAQDKYVRSLRRVTFSGKDRVLYKIGMTWEMLDELERANDFYYEIIRDFPDGDYSWKAEERIKALFLIIGKAPPSPADIARMPLTKARKTLRAHYKRFMAVIKSHKSGVTGRLKEAYENYRTSCVAYNKLLSTEYRKAVAIREHDRRRRLAEKTGEAPPDLVLPDITGAPPVDRPAGVALDPGRVKKGPLDLDTIRKEPAGWEPGSQPTEDPFDFDNDG